MSKLLRSELKEIVKECLVEILSEGLNNDNSQQIYESRNRKIRNTTNTPRKSHLDNITYNKKIENRKKEIEKTVLSSNITSDPILNELLADTASSTLQEQIAAEGKRGTSLTVSGDQAARVVDASDPTELFGNASNNWASLAFS